MERSRAGSRKIEIESERKIVAVGAIIMSSDGRILIVQETQDKPLIDKQAGDWTFPGETCREGELPEATLRRLIREEVGGIEFDIDFEEGWIGDYNGGNDQNPIWGRVYLVNFHGTSRTPAQFRAVDGEVIGHRWVLPRQLRVLPHRKGIEEPLGDFLFGNRRVVCWRCSPGDRSK